MDDARGLREVGELGHGLSGTLLLPVFAGREAELAALDAALERARRFRVPQFVTVTGGMGLGKTRLLAEWLGRARGQHVRVVETVAEPARDTSGAGETLAALLRARFALSPSWDATAALAAFRLELAHVFGDRRVAEVAGLLGRWLGFDLPDSPLAQALESRAGQRADLARAVLGRFLEQDAKHDVTLWVVDALELADDESLDVLESLAAELGEAPVVFVVAARPELFVRRPNWGRGEGSHVRLDLGPLVPRALDRVLRSMLGAASSDASLAGNGEPLPTALVERAVVESAGNPRLLGELLWLYQQHGALVVETRGEDDGWWFDLERASHLSLNGEGADGTARAQRRIEALPAIARELLARAACFGHTFWTGGVVALGRLGSEPAAAPEVFGPDEAIPTIRAVLAELTGQGILLSTSSTLPQDEAWTFAHEDERQLCLAAQDPETVRRRRLFAAQWLESRPGASRPDARDERLAALGAMYEEAGDSRRAAYCFLSAADGARTRLRHEEARELLTRALPLLGLDDAVAKLDACYALGDLCARRGRAHEAVQCFQDMLALAWRLDLPAKGAVAHSRLGRLRAQLGEMALGVEHLEAAHHLFQVASDRPGVAAALDDLGRLHARSGNPAAALERHRAALALREQLGDARGEAFSLARLSEVERDLGELQAALGHAREALDLRRRAGDRLGVIASWLGLGAIERDFGHLAEAGEILREGRRYALELGEELSVVSFDLELGPLALSQQATREARAFFEDARDRARLFGAKGLLAEAEIGLAGVALLEGDVEAACAAACDGYALADKVGLPVVRARALRVWGEAGGLDDVLGGPREMFEQAITILTEAKAELELARTLVAFARHEDASGRHGEAERLRVHAAMIEDRTVHAPAFPAGTSFLVESLLG